MNYNYTACCWFPTSSNILILPSQFWQIGFESCWLHCSNSRILVLLRYQKMGSLLGSVQSLSTALLHKRRTIYGPLHLADSIKIPQPWERKEHCSVRSWIVWYLDRNFPQLHLFRVSSIQWNNKFHSSVNLGSSVHFFILPICGEPIVLDL